MYDDIAQVRSHDVKLRFNDAENKVIDDVVAKMGGQRATLLRQMIIREARFLLAEDARRDALALEVAQESLLCV